MISYKSQVKYSYEMSKALDINRYNPFMQDNDKLNSIICHLKSIISEVRLVFLLISYVMFEKLGKYYCENKNSVKKVISITITMKKNI